MRSLEGAKQKGKTVMYIMLIAILFLKHFTQQQIEECSVLLEGKGYEERHKLDQNT